MNPEIKERWVAALRSGDYLQGRSYLNKIDGGRSFYCCLGVLCELATADGVVNRVVRDGHEDMIQTRVRYEGRDRAQFWERASEKVLPADVIRWAGLDDCIPEATYDGRTYTLSAMNDVDGLDFGQIADAIEESL